MKIETLSILMPVYNEAATIEKILDKVRNVELINGVKKELVVVDDCSNDNTIEVLEAYKIKHPAFNIQVYKQEKNKGKGAALHKGIEQSKGEYIIIQDADLEYNPEEYNDMLEPVFYDDADVVYGSRFMGGNPHRVLFFWHSIGNKILTFLSNMVSNLNLTDMETCYKLFRSNIIKSLSLKEKRFGFEPEVTLKMSRIPNIKVYEVGISYYGRTYAEGKKINAKDGFRAIYCILKYGVLKTN